MADTTIWRIEINSFARPITEKEIEQALSKIPYVKNIDIEQLPPYHYVEDE